MERNLITGLSAAYARPQRLPSIKTGKKDYLIERITKNKKAFILINSQNESFLFLLNALEIVGAVFADWTDKVWGEFIAFEDITADAAAPAFSGGSGCGGLDIFLIERIAHGFSLG